MLDRIINKRYFPLFVFLAAAGLYLFNSWGVSIYILDEAKNASCAREMLENGNILAPTFNGALRTDKPPLHYFFMFMSYTVFGVNPFGARFFSAIFGALTVLMTFRYTQKFSNTQTAFWTSIVLLASIHLSIQFHLAVPDPYLIFFMVWSHFAFFAAINCDNKREVFYMYFAMAMGTLAKGPVAILLPGLVFLLFLVFSRNLKWKTIAKLKPLTGALLVLLLVLPWYILNGIETDWEWTRGFFLKHNINRFSDSMEGHGGSFLITLLFILAGMFPFSVYLPQAILSGFKQRKNPFILFNLVAGITIVVFFSISQTKLPNYTVPSYPFLAVLTAFFIGNKTVVFKNLKVGFFVLLSLSILLPIAGFIAMKFDPSLESVRGIAAWLLVLPVINILVWIYRKHRSGFLLLQGLSGILTAVVFFAFIYPAIDQQNPVAKSKELIKNRELVYFEKFNPSYAFYQKKEIPKIDADEFYTFFENHPDGLIISTKKKIKPVLLDEKYEIIFSAKDVFESPTTVLIAKKK
ncbi:glycosyltransferase family 39 protein [Draconibacterium orientale]|uniref:ArnT family glycosyltransferase n=1 Tax=Draconibacterium orientale TaxID=1168034 RepID=UPI0029C00EF4|nr:glycosyltransferase family 39 protein [Draconibacterium orientale]